ncbi:unnamed protein product [Coregonus sp. 'balchen']|nr:unnamed protein product [Coregonus sp. 'balchen']
MDGDPVCFAGCAVYFSTCTEDQTLLIQQATDTEKESLVERERIKSQIWELRSHQTQQGRKLHRTGSNSGMVLVLDPLVRDEVPGTQLTRPQPRDPVTSSEPDVVLSHRQRSDSTASDRSLASRPRLDSGASEKSLGSAFRTRVDSGASDRSQCSAHRGRLDSGASESRFRQRLDSGTSDSSMGPPAPLGSETSDSAGLLSRKRLDSGTSDLSVGVFSVGRSRVEQPVVTMSSSSSSIESEAESTNHHPVQPRQDSSTTNCYLPDGAVLFRKAPDSHSGLLNGSAKERGDIQEQKVRYTLLTPLSKSKDAVPEKKEPVVLAPFGRANSVRDRMRKFTEPSPSVPVLKRGSQSLRNTTAPSARVLGRATQLSEGPAAGPAKQTAGTTAVSITTPTDRPGRPHLGSTSYSSSSSSSNNHVQCQGTVHPGGVATKSLQSAAQSLNAVGGANQTAEMLRLASDGSKEDKTPGRAAAQRDSKGAADPDMKTFLTIEIKDGRTTTTSSSSSRGNLAPMAPRITTNAIGQRAAPPLHANISLQIPLESLLPWETRDATGAGGSQPGDRPGSGSVCVWEQGSAVDMEQHSLCDGQAHCVEGELTLGLRATPFKMSSSSLTTGSSFKTRVMSLTESDPLILACLATVSLDNSLFLEAAPLSFKPRKTPLSRVLLTLGGLSYDLTNAAQLTHDVKPERLQFVRNRFRGVKLAEPSQSARPRAPSKHPVACQSRCEGQGL